MFVFVGYDLEFGSVANTAQLQRHYFGERSTHVRVCQLCEEINKIYRNRQTACIENVLCTFSMVFLSLLSENKKIQDFKSQLLAPFKTGG